MLTSPPPDTDDALHRVVSARETYGKATRSYRYDSLGNLTYESNSNNETWDHKPNNLNQITQKADDKGKDTYFYSYDNRGNLTQLIYQKNKKQSVDGAYVYDETNKMVSGSNAAGEVSNYICNGLGALIRNEWHRHPFRQTNHTALRLCSLGVSCDTSRRITTATTWGFLKHTQIGLVLRCRFQGRRSSM